MNAVQQSNGGFDDGFSEPHSLRGEIAKWNDQKGWHDRDGLPLPQPMLILGVAELLIRWYPQREEIRAKPSPDPGLLNSAIPISEWRTGLDGKPEPPWKLNFEIRMIDPATGTLYVFANSTGGAQKCFDLLREAVCVTRALRGSKVVPVVKLEQRPWPTQFGMRSRPHLSIIDWREPPDDGGPLPLAPPPAPQLTAAAPAITSQTPPPAAAPPKAPAAATTLDGMKPVKPIPIEEFIGDELPPWA
jgi:hypothetical protein